jgi:hypothetical protein
MKQVLAWRGEIKRTWLGPEALLLRRTTFTRKRTALVQCDARMHYECRAWNR